MRARVGPLVGALVVALALAGCTSSGSSGPSSTSATPLTQPSSSPASTSPGDTVAPAQKRVFDELMNQVADVRGLKWKGPLDLRVVPPDDLAQRLKAVNERDADPAQIAAQEQALKLLRLIPQDVDLRATIDGLLTGLVVGFYDPITKKLFVAGTDLGPATRYVIAHEMTHALTDQWFDYGPPTEALDKAGKTEESAGYTALIEGDAVLTQDRWAAKYLKPDEVLAAKLGGASGGDLAALAKAPSYLVESLIFPYDEGLDFVKALFDKGGNEALNAAYRKPPTSTEHIIHPETYTAGQGAASPALPDLAAATGCTNVYKGVVGQFDMRAVLSSRLSPTDADKAVEGWNGDSLSVVRCGSASGLADRWETDPGVDGSRLFNALSQWAGTWAGNSRAPGTDGRFSGPNGSGRITRSGSHVDLVLAADTATVDRLVRALS